MLDIVLIVEAADHIAALFDDPQFRQSIAMICEPRQLAAFAALLERTGDVESAEYLHMYAAERSESRSIGPLSA